MYSDDLFSLYDIKFIWYLYSVFDSSLPQTLGIVPTADAQKRSEAKVSERVFNEVELVLFIYYVTT